MGRRPAVWAGGSALAVVASIAVLVAWSPWAASVHGEGGTGSAAAAASARSAGPPVVSRAEPPAPLYPPRPAAAVRAVTGWIATLRSPLGYAASPGGPVVGRLSADNPFGTPTVLAVIGSPGPGGWAHVELPMRPNGSTGWVPTASVALSWTPYQVRVSLAARTVTVLDGGQPVISVSAAVGAPRTPTPAGQTYLWELVRPDDPRGAYGPYIFGLAMFSNAYSVFNGGDAQIGLHGNDDPTSIGRPVSHGCVRLDNAVITRLAGLLPLDTPVAIS